MRRYKTIIYNYLYIRRKREYSMIIHNMKTNRQVNPIGIDSRSLCFSWNVQATRKNWKQEAYRIILVNKREALQDEEEFLWDTGWLETDLMVNIIYTGSELSSDTRYYWQVSVIANDSDDISTSEITYFETGLFHASDWRGKWIGEVEDHNYHIFRKNFRLEKEIQRAKLYVCGLGHYEFNINGTRIGDCQLEPGWTNYNKSCIYSSYDVTKELKKGDNALGNFLGDGMYNVPGGRYVYYSRTFGKCKLLVQMNITYKDGTTTEIVTDETWRMAPSPIKFCCIYGGEDYDSRLEQKKFCIPQFQENESWHQVNMVEHPKGKLNSRSIPPVKVMKTYEPVKITEIKQGVYLYDLGTNFSGWVRVTMKSNKNMSGTVVTMTPGEILNESQEPDQRVTGRGYHWQYTLSDDEIHNYAPKFTYTGFRYVMVEGAIPKECLNSLGEPRMYDMGKKDENTLPIIESLVGEFLYADVELNGEFTCSNQLFNRIHGIINQAILSNMKSILTDCPHREKLGWLEQVHLIGPAIMYNYNVHDLYYKIEQDIKESQREDGLISDISPEYIKFGYHAGFTDSPEWGSTSIISPWYIYKQYGDILILDKYYKVMKNYLNYLTSMSHHHVLHHGLGDWLDIGPNTPHSQNTPVPVIATTIYYYDISIMKQVAELLGKKEDVAYYSDLQEKVFTEYNLQFFDDQTFRYATGSQAAQAMSLVVGLVAPENEQKVLEYLVKDIKVRDFATTAGDIGHPFVMVALMMYGGNHIINTMTNVTDKPGYGYQVKCGATTLTEEWDGPNPTRPHGSQNHFMLGSVEEWFYGGLAGIQSIRNDNTLNEITIKPHFADGIDSVSAWTMHPYGKISIQWERQENVIAIRLQIPANTTAYFMNELDGSSMNLGSGEYEFTIDWKGKHDDIIK